MERLERKLSRFAIPQLSLVLALGQVLVLVLCVIRAQFMNRLVLVPDLVMEGEIWRLVTFLFIPPGTDILALLCIYGLWFMGSCLESHWGTFRFNLYVLIAILATIGTAWINPQLPVTGGYIAGSIFLAFAWLYPDFVFYIFFIIPVKAKYLAVVTWIWFIVILSTGSFADRVAVLASIANFLLFFGSSLFHRMRHGRYLMEQHLVKLKERTRPRHICSECGITDHIDPQIDFRYCSKCQGSFEFCEKHLRTHEHRTAENATTTPTEG